MTLRLYYSSRCNCSRQLKTLQESTLITLKIFNEGNEKYILTLQLLSSLRHSTPGTPTFGAYTFYWNIMPGLTGSLCQECTHTHMDSSTATVKASCLAHNGMGWEYWIRQRSVWFYSNLILWMNHRIHHKWEKLPLLTFNFVNTCVPFIIIFPNSEKAKIDPFWMSKTLKFCTYSEQIVLYWGS